MSYTATYPRVSTIRRDRAYSLVDQTSTSPRGIWSNWKQRCRTNDPQDSECNYSIRSLKRCPLDMNDRRNPVAIKQSLRDMSDTTTSLGGMSDRQDKYHTVPPPVSRRTIRRHTADIASSRSRKYSSVPPHKGSTGHWTDRSRRDIFPWGLTME